MTDEVKRCVEILRKAVRFGVIDCQYCPAYSVCPTGTVGWNNECMLDTAADLIESLAAELEQVKRERDGLNIMLGQAQSMLETRTRERDAAVEGLRGACAFCAHVRECLVTGCTGDMGEACKQCPCETCFHDSNWQWRGVREG